MYILTVLFVAIFIFFNCNKKSPTGNEETSTVTDIDGNIYQTVKIRFQWWMAENLKVTHYRNGDAIPYVTDSATWGALSTGAYCVYDNDEDNASTYGYLYNWYAVDDSRNIAPEGWHVATDAEWQTLVVYLGGETVAGGKLKEAGTTHWNSPNTGATNESGFSALPGGYRYDSGNYYSLISYASFWTSTESYSSTARFRRLDYNNSEAGPGHMNKGYGFSVRCIRD